MKKADFILIGVVGVVVAVLFIFLYGVNSSSGAYVQIEVDGEVVQTLPLDTATTYDISTADGGENTLVIEDSCAKMTSANCPDKTCTKHIKISRNGESIICLPHKLVVSVVNEKNSDEIDAVA
jgi:hypothetical protein